MLLQEYAITGRAIKPKAEPKDHVRENVRRMRHIQKASRQREAEKQSPVKALWKCTKYEGIPSRVKDDLLQNGPPAPRPKSTDYLRAHSRTGFSPLLNESASDETLFSSSQHDGQGRRKEVNFVKMNTMAAKHSGMRRSPSLTALDDLKKKHNDDESDYQRGTLPKYLEHRKQEWADAEAERRANIPDPQMPPGHKLLPTQDRMLTLDKLKSSEQELLCQLNSLPIRSDTPRVRARKDEISQKLNNIDEAIKIFSRVKVFVKMDV